MKEFDPTLFLEYGLIGLGCLLAILSFWLLSREQDKGPRKPMITSIYVFMAFSITMCAFGIIEKVIPDSNLAEELETKTRELNECSSREENLQSENTKLRQEKNRYQSEAEARKSESEETSVRIDGLLAENASNKSELAKAKEEAEKSSTKNKGILEELRTENLSLSKKVDQLENNISNYKDSLSELKRELGEKDVQIVDLLHENGEYKEVQNSLHSLSAKLKDLLETCEGTTFKSQWESLNRRFNELKREAKSNFPDDSYYASLDEDEKPDAYHTPVRIRQMLTHVESKIR